MSDLAKAQIHKTKSASGEKENTCPNAPKLIYPPEGFVFDTHTHMQNEFIEKITSVGIDDALKWLEGVKGNLECSYPEVLTFSWEGGAFCEYVFELSQNEDFVDSYSIKCNEPSCSISNLKVGEKYFWRVNNGKPNSFCTKNNHIRFIKIDGALNVRDLGANKIKQGLIYRGSDLCSHYKITDSGKDTFVNELKIKTEVELRKERCEKVSAAGGGVVYKHLPYRPYKEIFEEEHRKGICRIMDFLSDESNYPIYIHCLGGADRTGMIAFFLRALANESDEFIHLDYELTSLSTYAYGLAEGAEANGYRSRNSSYYQEFLGLLDAYAPSKTLHEKVKSFLFDCGVKKECMEKITKIICK